MAQYRLAARLPLLGMALASATLLGACAIGSGTTHVEAPTIGQEMLDLQRARDSGAISAEEYESLKQAVKRRAERGV